MSAADVALFNEHVSFDPAWSSEALSIEDEVCGQSFNALQLNRAGNLVVLAKNLPFHIVLDTALNFGIALLTPHVQFCSAA
jgi:hypothetical protein